MIQAYQWELRPSCFKLEKGVEVVWVGVDKLTAGGMLRDSWS